MKQAWRWLLVAAAVSLLPNAALAQQKKKKPAAPAAPAPPTTPAAGGAAGAGGEIELDAPATPAPGAAAPGAETPPAPGGAAEGATPPAGAGGGGICDIDPTACPKQEDVKAAAKKQVNAEIYAVQQIYALRRHRFELQPWWSFSLNDQFVTHEGPGLGLNYYITNVLAIGISGDYYLNSDSDFNFQNRRAARIAVPLNYYLTGADFNMTYVPVYGKFAGFSNFIFSYDAYVLAGLGALWTKPLAVIDPDNRNFSYTPKLDFSLAVGLRIFFNRWFTVNLELRNHIYDEKLESTTVAPTLAQQQNPATWYGNNEVTVDVQAQVGVSIFLPFSWEYRLPK